MILPFPLRSQIAFGNFWNMLLLNLSIWSTSSLFLKSWLSNFKFISICHLLDVLLSFFVYIEIWGGKYILDSGFVYIEFDGGVSTVNWGVVRMIMEW